MQYLSQQSVARLARIAKIALPKELPFPEALSAVQELAVKSDESAVEVFRSVGTYLAFAVAHYADFYRIENVLLLGRVMSGTGGEILLGEARSVLAEEFPALAEEITLHTLDERQKRHGQAMAAASLPTLHQ